MKGFHPLIYTESSEKKAFFVAEVAWKKNVPVDVKCVNVSKENNKPGSFKFVGPEIKNSIDHCILVGLVGSTCILNSSVKCRVTGITMNMMRRGLGRF